MRVLDSSKGFSLIEAVISLAGAGILLTGLMSAVSLVHKSSQAVSVKGKQIDFANYIKTQVDCAETLRGQTARCGTGRYIYLRNKLGYNLTNRTANGSPLIENLYLRSKCVELNSSYQLDIEHQITDNGAPPVRSSYSPMFKIPFVCAAPPPPAPRARTLTAMRIPGGCFKARHGGSGLSARLMNDSRDNPVECSFEMDLSTNPELRPTDTIVGMQISFTTGEAPFNCHVQGNCERSNVRRPADFTNYMPHSIWAGFDNVPVVFNTDTNGEGPILISGDPILYPEQRSIMRNFIRNKANEGGFRCTYEGAPLLERYIHTHNLDLIQSETIRIGTDTFVWNPTSKRLRVTNRRFDPNLFSEDLVGSSRWDGAAGACLGDFTVTLTVNSP